MTALTSTQVPRLSAGVLTADWTRLGEELSILRGTGPWAHVDVMDGQFCPALTAGAPLVRAAASSGVPVDAHLMVAEPRRFLAEIAAAGATVVTVHAESTRHLHGSLVELTALAAEHPSLVRGIGLNPGTPVEVLGPVLELVDLVLVLAVDPGWAGSDRRLTPSVGWPTSGAGGCGGRTPAGRGRRWGHPRQCGRGGVVGPTSSSAAAPSSTGWGRPRTWPRFSTPCDP